MKPHPLPRESLRLYGVTGDAFFTLPDWPDKMEQALRGGMTAVQLRAKDLPVRQIYRHGLIIRDLCRRFDVPFFVNDRLDLALALSAEGIHLGQEDLPVAVARSISGNRMWIGVSAKTPGQTREAIQQGADYIGSGAAFASGSKPDSSVIGCAGIASVADAAAAASCPVVAIGGIRLDNLRQLLPLYESESIAGIAVLSSVLHASDPETAARSFRMALAREYPSRQAGD